MELAQQLLAVLTSYALPLWATIIARIFIVISLLLPLFLLFNHLSAYKNPEEQKFLVGVILMVPCYAGVGPSLTVNYAVEPINEKLHMIFQNLKKHEKEKKKTNDDSCIKSPPSLNRVISGIDDPLLNGSLSDNSGPKKARPHRRKSGYASAESGGENSDHGLGGYEIRGHRWITRE